jgi:hypothetical protein
LLSSWTIITTDSEEKHHGYTSQEVSQEVWRQIGKQASWTRKARSIGEARTKELEQQTLDGKTWWREEVRSETSGRQEGRGQTRGRKSKEQLQQREESRDAFADVTRDTRRERGSSTSDDSGHRRIRDSERVRRIHCRSRHELTPCDSIHDASDAMTTSRP